MALRPICSPVSWRQSSSPSRGCEVGVMHVRPFRLSAQGELFNVYQQSGLHSATFHTILHAAQQTELAFKKYKSDRITVLKTLQSLHITARCRSTSKCVFSAWHFRGVIWLWGAPQPSPVALQASLHGPSGLRAPAQALGALLSSLHLITSPLLSLNFTSLGEAFCDPSCDPVTTSNSPSSPFALLPLFN